MEEPQPGDGEPCVEIRDEHGGRVARLVLTAPPENPLDILLVESLGRAVAAVAGWPDLRAVVLEGSGAHFSTGHPASQLRPPFAAAVVEGLHAAARTLLALDALLLAPVRGRCEGAGAALALVADLVLADPTTRFLFVDSAGHLPPLTPLLLAERLDRGRALSGKALTGEEALSLRLIKDYAGGWESLETMTAHHVDRLALTPPAESLRITLHALRADTLTHVADQLPELERRTLDRLGRSPRIPSPRDGSRRPSK